MNNKKFAPNFERIELSEEERYLIEPFFTNLDESVFCIRILPPEVIGALCSRTSRAKDDLRIIFLKEYLKPFLGQSGEYTEALRGLIEFLHKYPAEIVFSNPRAREFYVKWLSQFGDDSIAQMAGISLVYSGLSQIAIKQIEDMRIGIAPIEKSTRYVDYSSKINGKYRYYTDPTLFEMGLGQQYIAIMDNLFETYSQLKTEYMKHLRKRYPGESDKLIKTKAFDTIRTILPVSVMSQLSLFGNAQAFEYMINRGLEHNLGEIRWSAEAGLQELRKNSPSFFVRVESQQSAEYRRYLSERSNRIQEVLEEIGWQDKNPSYFQKKRERVKLIEYDPEGEDKIITGLIYPEKNDSFEEIFSRVKKLSVAQKERILRKVLSDRKFRWYKVPRAFENANVRFEIEMNIGAWRDLHRHRMHTQQRQRFCTIYGFDVPQELEESGLSGKFKEAVLKLDDLFTKVEQKDPELAQYCVALAHRIRFQQWQNLRQFFWEAELRTIPQGHPDYREIEQEKIQLIQKVYPLISKYLLVDMQKHYDFARRGTAEEIAKKEAALRKFIES